MHGGAEAAGKFYFHCDNAKQITVSTSFDNGVGYVANLAKKVESSTVSSTDFVIVSGNTNQMLTWRVDYTCDDGVTRTAWAYTYVYKPNRIPTGVASEAERDRQASKQKESRLCLRSLGRKRL